MSDPYVSAHAEAVRADSGSHEPSEPALHHVTLFPAARTGQDDDPSWPGGAAIATATGDRATADSGGDPGENLPSVSQIDRLASDLLSQAVRQGASDIHLDPYGGGLQVSLRIDGTLHVIDMPQPEVRRLLATRLKLQANLDVVERRYPQHGRFTLTDADRDLDVRLSVVSTPFGEKLDLRLLQIPLHRLALEPLILHPRALAHVQAMIRQPKGLVVVAGPHGSGCTTPLYAAVSERNASNVNIVTIEVPVEYAIPGLNQVQVRPEVGFDFDVALQAAGRQDPDIILVGDTRDAVTARGAVHAALSGRLVLTALDARDTASAFVRLAEMGVAQYEKVNVMAGIIAQRLIRRTCPACRTEVRPDAAVLRRLNEHGVQTATFVRGQGCPACHGSSYKGRIALMETLMPSPQGRVALTAATNDTDLTEALSVMDRVTFRECATFLLERGETTVKDVLPYLDGEGR